MALLSPPTQLQRQCLESAKPAATTTTRVLALTRRTFWLRRQARMLTTWRRLRHQEALKHSAALISSTDILQSAITAAIMFCPLRRTICLRTSTHLLAQHLLSLWLHPMANQIQKWKLSKIHQVKRLMKQHPRQIASALELGAVLVQAGKAHSEKKEAMVMDNPAVKRRLL